jgi:hypothetical protein
MYRFLDNSRSIHLSISILFLAICQPAPLIAGTPGNGWWNDKPNCLGNYYRYFDFNIGLRYFMPSSKVEHLHVQPIRKTNVDTYIDEYDSVKYMFNFSDKKLRIYWLQKNTERIWHYCAEQDVQASYLSMLKAYLINKNYIDLAEAEEDGIYSGDDFLKQQCILSFKNKNYNQALDDCTFSWRSNKNGLAAFYLGQMYQWGSLGERDYKKSFAWYKKSAAVEYSDSYEWLGWSYRFGKGTKPNPELAEKYYLLSSEFKKN